MRGGLILRKISAIARCNAYICTFIIDPEPESGSELKRMLKKKFDFEILMKRLFQRTKELVEKHDLKPLAGPVTAFDVSYWDFQLS